MKEVLTNPNDTSFTQNNFLSETEGNIKFRERDFVRVTCDEEGKITRGIQRPGIGEILRISNTPQLDSDRYYLVKMLDGSTSYLSSEYLEVIPTVTGKCSNHKILLNGTTPFAVSENGNFYQVGDLVEVTVTKEYKAEHALFYPLVGKIEKISASDESSAYYTIKTTNGETKILSSNSFTRSQQSAIRFSGNIVFTNMYGSHLAIKENEHLYALGDKIKVINKDLNQVKHGKITCITCVAKTHSCYYSIVIEETGELLQLTSREFQHENSI